MSEPLAPKNAWAFQTLGAQRYADCFALDLKTITATGPDGQHTQADIDQVVAVIDRKFAVANTRPAPQTPRAQQAPTSSPGAVTQTTAEMIADLYADPDMHRAMWKIGVRDIKKPAAAITYYEPSTPRPQVVDNGDGSAHWESPPMQRWPGDAFEQEAKRLEEQRRV